MKRNHSILKKTLSQGFPFLNGQDLDYFVNQWHIHKKLNRFDFLTNPGEVERNLYFIIKGTFHIYQPFKTPVTSSLAIPNSFYNSFSSFLTQQPSKVHLQALSKAEVIGISKECFDKCILKNWNIEKAYRLGLESITLNLIQKDFLLKLPASQRVQIYLDNHPQIFQLIPYKYIASFLNIAPETFSRILNVPKS